MGFEIRRQIFVQLSHIYACHSEEEKQFEGIANEAIFVLLLWRLKWFKFGLEITRMQLMIPQHANHTENPLKLYQQS